MTMENYMYAMKISEYLGDSVSIGGGEPTIHPSFKLMLLEAIANTEYIWLATNGSMTKTAMLLLKLAESEVISVALSQDTYHDPIDEKVVEAYKGACKRKKGYVEVRNATGAEKKVGRSNIGEESCCCPTDLFIRPNGDVHKCGCMDSPKLGHISQQNKIISLYEDYLNKLEDVDCCYKEQKLMDD